MRCWDVFLIIFADFGDFLCYMFVTFFGVFLLFFVVFLSVFVMFFCHFFATFLTLFACLFDVVWRLRIAPCSLEESAHAFSVSRQKFSHKKMCCFFFEFDSRFQVFRFF